MTDYLSNKELWRKYTEIHSQSDYYGLKEFLAGGNKLHSLERGEVGPVDGKSLLHLQCHFGLDTLSWARLGASVTGMDFSDAAIDMAAAIAKEVNLPARFICSDVYDLPNRLREQFDVVFTSYGILTWLPDIPRWAQIAASYVKPGGFLYLVEFHPFAQIFDEASPDYTIKYPYFERQAIVSTADASYADADAKFEPITVYEWNHPISEVISSLIQAGLQIEFVHEFAESVYQQFPHLVETFVDREQFFVFPEGVPPFPLMYSIRASKPA
jgi:SAM-dependent methyltransferase